MAHTIDEVWDDLQDVIQKCNHIKNKVDDLAIVIDTINTELVEAAAAAATAAANAANAVSEASHSAGPGRGP